jgi:D-alanyl-D-alanine carboxypeptidase
MGRPAAWRLLRSAALAATLAAIAVPFPAPTAAVTSPPVPQPSSSGNPPPCRIADVPAKFSSTADWSRTMLDWIYPVPATYKPPNLVPVSRAAIGGSGSVRAELIPDLKAMAAAARAAGTPIAVASAYRSYATQIATFNDWVSRLGYSKAILGAARPGHSEHQLGTTIDFRSYGSGDPWLSGGYDWGKTRAGRWMLANAWKYGFVLSYPYGKRSEVCYGYEPWHYRYFGRAVARAIHESGLTTRVWLWRHGSSPLMLIPGTRVPRLRVGMRATAGLLAPRPSGAPADSLSFTCRIPGG